MQDAGNKVTVYFVVQENVCEFATSEKAMAERFVDSFNRLRLESMPPVEIRTKQVCL